MTLLGAGVGAGIGLGLLLVFLGWRGFEVAEQAPRWWRRAAAERVLLRAAGVVGAAATVWMLTGWVVGGLVAAAAAVLVPAVLRHSAQQQQAIQRTEAIAAWTEMLRDTLAPGAAGLEQAIRTSAEHAPEAIRPEAQRLARRLNHRPLGEALRQFADEVGSPASDLVVAALVTADRYQAGDLSPLLGDLAGSTRLEASMRRAVHASRARIRTTVRGVTASFLLLVGVLLVFQPEFVEVYQSAAGQLILLAVGGIFVASYWLMQRMAQIPAPRRFLTRQSQGGR